MESDIKIKRLEQTVGKESQPLPEAPVSLHIDSYYKGFHVGLTQRDPEMQTETYGLLKNAKKLIDLMVKDGWDPSWNKETNRQIKTSDKKQEVKLPKVQARVPEKENPYEGNNTVCTFHNVAMKERVNKKTGASFFSHGEKVDGKWRNCSGIGY